MLEKGPDLTRLFDLSLDLLCIAGLDGYFKKLNPAFQNTLGFTSEELMSKPFIEFVHPEDQEITLKELAKLAKGKPAIWLETRHQCKDGTYKWLSWKASTHDHEFFGTARDITDLKKAQESLKESEATVLLDDQKVPPKPMGTVQDITERKKAEEALKESQERQALIFNNSREILNLIAYDSKGGHKLVAVNKAFLEMVQLDEKQVVGQKIGQILPKEDQEYVLKQYRNAARLKKPLRDVRLFKVPGGEVYFETDVIPIIDKGKVTHILNVARNITGERKAELALKESEEKYRTLFEKAPIGIALSDEDGNLIAYNKAILKPGGYTDQDLKKIRSVSGFYFEKRAREKIFQTLRKKGFVDRQEVRLKKKDGSAYYGLMSLNPIQIEGKQCYMALIEDITDTKKDQDRLKFSERRLKTIVENVHEAIMLFSPQIETYIGVNKKAVQLFGYSEKELLKTNPVDLSPIHQGPDILSRAMIKEKMEQALQGKNPVFEWLHQNSKGKVIECEVRLTKVPYLDQQIVMSSVVDITERKAQERERENLIDELDRFVYSASHDLSAPLKSLRGLINLAKIDPSEDTKIDYLEKMDSSIARLEGFIADIINYSRNSRLEVKAEKVNPEYQVGEVLENLKFMEGFDKIDFRVKVPAGQSYVWADPFRLKIILNNLFSNAIKFYRPGAKPFPFIEIKIKPLKRGFTIDVKDNGKGIAKRYQAKIFEMFFRANSDTTGSGLGLYIARETAKRMNGDLTFESKRGKGSLFRLAVQYPE